jgi:hypothetical protein
LVTLTDIAAMQSVVGVLMSLVKRDEQMSEESAKMKLGDKLVKWTSSESEKIASAKT